MTGVLFTPPAYVPHVAHIIKLNDENRNPATAIQDDAELFAPLRPSTIYSVRILLYFAGFGAGGGWRPALTQTADFFAMVQHRGVSSNTTDLWSTGSANDHFGQFYTTDIFNAATPLFIASQGGAKEAYGMIQTGTAGGTFSVKWGNSAVSVTCYAGSFMYLQEAAAY